MNKLRAGTLFGLAGFGIWGFVALYWSHLENVDAYEIVAHRSIWTLFFAIIILGITGELRKTWELVKQPRIATGLLFASLAVSVNWLVFIWAANHDHIVETSLGYYINPLMVIAFGTLVLKEKMRKLQLIATIIASIGVAVLTIGYGHPPYIAIVIALSWSCYSLIKKQLAVPAVSSLAIETAFLFIPYMIFLGHLSSQGRNHFGHQFGTTALLIGGGLITAIPLLFFIGATNRLPLTTIGLMQYITPSISFMIGVFVRHEEMSTYRWIGFMIVWIALGVLSTDLIASGRTLRNSVTE